MFKNLTLIVLTLLATSAIADSAKPACSGTEINPAFRGTYESVTKDSEVQTIVFEKDTETVTFAGLVATYKAWSCQVDGVDILVSDFGVSGETYESRIVLLSGDHLIDVGEVYGSADFSLPPDTTMSAKLQHFLKNNSQDFSFMRRKK